MEANSYQYNFILSSFGLNKLQQLFLKDISVEQRAVIATGKLGTPVWDRLIIQDSESNPSLKFTCDIALIEVVKPVIIKRTYMANNRGSVKERIFTGDHEITIRGMINSSDKDDYPREDIQTLDGLSNLGISLVVISDYLQLLNIYNIVITRLRLPQRAGRIAQQAFEITALSDYAPELAFMPDVTPNLNDDYTYNLS
jgi:hypothetical protein